VGVNQLSPTTGDKEAMPKGASFLEESMSLTMRVVGESRMTDAVVTQPYADDRPGLRNGVRPGMADIFFEGDGSWLVAGMRSWTFV
jgi:hypothetical protein